MISIVYALLTTVFRAQWWVFFLLPSPLSVRNLKEASIKVKVADKFIGVNSKQRVESVKVLRTLERAEISKKFCMITNSQLADFNVAILPDFSTTCSNPLSSLFICQEAPF